MDKFHVCNIDSKSGIARYAEDFFSVILQKSGFIPISPRKVTGEWLSNLPKESIFHVELGGGQYAERDALTRLVGNGFKNVDVTIHDAPWVTFPYYHCNHSILNQLSKAFDWYCNSAGAAGRLLKRCRRVYVLSRAGKLLLEQRHHLANVHYIPHVINADKVREKSFDGNCNDIMFFGFIGPDKGLDYALAVHAEICRHKPDIAMYVVGQPFNSKGQRYLDRLKRRYPVNVNYLGFIDEANLDNIFAKVGHIFLPFHQYKYRCPSSGTVLSALRRGLIVWTNPVNSVCEIVTDGVNGLFFSGDIGNDAEKFIQMTGHLDEMCRLSAAATQTCQRMHAELEQRYIPG